VRQQTKFLESQLTAYSFVSITGLDNTDFWTSQDVWDAALQGKHGVISTPQILQDALSHGFVHLEDISLLVFDEAHHANNNHPMNCIMRHYYHPLKSIKPEQAPHILGLTASPMNKDDRGLIKQLQENLHAVCRFPTASIEEYRKYAHCPEFVRLDYEATGGRSELHEVLKTIIEDYDIEEDPEYKRLAESETHKGRKKFEKVLKGNATSLLKQLRKLANHAEHMIACLGPWITDHYISTCVGTALERTSQLDQWLFTLEDEQVRHLQKTLNPLLAAPIHKTVSLGLKDVSDKVKKLVHYLDENLSSGSACMVFAERKSVVWALKELLDRMPLVSRFRAFGLVGSTNIHRNELADLADTKLQDEYFAEFRAGERDICICSSVGEEGLDIQACNLVICFDHPANVKSFVQRRGRARQAKSRFVILQGPEKGSTKYAKWEELELAMKEDYETCKRTLERLNLIEDNKEHCDWELRVEATGARLSTSNAVSHLNHFCQTLPRRGHLETDCSPVYILKGTHNIDMTCQVVLPASLPPQVQTAFGRSKWRTEAMAKKDAAFQAYVALYKAGLVNNNLLPPVVDKPAEVESHLNHESVQEVQAPFDPWHTTRNALKDLQPVFAHRLAISKPGTTMANLIILLPTPLSQSIIIELHLTTNMKILARVLPRGQEPYLIDHHLASSTTKILFGSVLARKLHGLESADYSLPYYVVPEIPITDMPQWLANAGQRRPLALEYLKSGREITILKLPHLTPYILDTRDVPASILEDTKVTVRATKLSRRLDFISPHISPEPQPKELEVKDCVALGLSPDYVRTVSFLPSIMHNLLIALRSQKAMETVLQPALQCRDLNLITTALTSSGATHFDYQRLEYYGDVLLKYQAVAHAFFNNPLATEGQLTTIYSGLVSNDRLLQSTLDLGLHRFISAEAFTSRLWTLGGPGLHSETQQISSKTLADIIESLLAVTFIEGVDRGEEQLLKALALFLPEAKWEPPAQLVSSFAIPETADSLPETLIQVEMMLGYTFTHKALLVEALTGPDVQTGHGNMRSYDRLEFLGDAIIDLLVKTALFNSPHGFDENEMTTRHICLVNQHILGFLSTRTGIDLAEKSVTFDAKHCKPVVCDVVNRKSLHDFVVRGNVSDLEIEHKKMFLHSYEEWMDEINSALDEGGHFPWTSLHALNAPKWCSDIIESLTAAVFIDSGASLEPCRNVLENIGLMQLVNRAANDKSWDMKQPPRKVRDMNSQVHFQTKVFKGGRWGCRIKLGDQKLAVVVDCACEAEAESRAAEEVLKKIEEGVIDIRTKKQKRKEEQQLQNGTLDEERSDHEIEDSAEESRKRKREDVMDIDE
jgi:ERCC4-related helicase/dsRNA-specific ribonuclease